VYCQAAQSPSERLCMQSCKIGELVGGQACLRVGYLSCALSCSIKFSRLLWASLRYRKGPTLSPSRVLKYQRSCSLNILSLRSGTGALELSFCRFSGIGAMWFSSAFLVTLYPLHWPDEKSNLCWSPLARSCSRFEN